MTHVMHYFTIEQRDELQTEMNRRADVLRGEIAEALRSSDSSQGIHLANHIEEIDDNAVASLEASLDVAQLERDVKELRALEAAQRRLHTAEFGLCETCGADIPFARLMAAPFATRCTGCQAAHEHRTQDTPGTL